MVTVLFVFPINITGDEPIENRSILPRPYAWGSIGLAIGLALFLILKMLGIIDFPAEVTLKSAIDWDARYLDILLQVVLIFSGVLGVIGILAPGKNEATKGVQE